MEHKKKIWIISVVCIVVAAAIGLFFWLKYQTYYNVEIITTFENSDSGSANYFHYDYGTLRYSRDGIALLTDEGDEVWNQSYQMNHPSIERCGSTVAVGDLQGTTILVMEPEGLKGEIHTTKPIESFSVSEQGIVCAILKDDQMPMVMCYDAKGNILVEQKSTFDKEGYPIDVAVSYDGTAIMVSYLKLTNLEMSSDVVCYYFGDETSGQYEVKRITLENQMVPVTAYLNKKTSLVVGDSTMYLYEGLEEPEQITEISLEQQIRSIAYGDKIIGVFLKNEGEGYSLKIYDYSGRELSSQTLEKDFANMKVEDGKIILYDGTKCAIYEKNGHLRFDGEMKSTVKDVYEVSGFLKYMVINEEGFQEIRLTK